MNRKKFREGLRDGLPIALGYLAVSFGIGISCHTAGISAFQGFLMSLLNNASAGEYGGITVITENAGAQPYVCCLTAERYACPYGICDQIRTHPDYAALFFDDTLHERVIRKIAEHSLGRYISALAGQCTLTPAQAETIFYFQLNGCLAVNRQIFRSGGANWEESRDLIGGFIQSGLLRYRK